MLFRHKGSYLPTNFSEKILDHVKSLSGKVHITAVESFINHVIIPTNDTFYPQFANITIEFIADSENLKIDRRKADIAIRLARPEEGEMVISKLTEWGFAVYISSNQEIDIIGNYLAVEPRGFI
jgi:DNA-binding transcriptional LysR family regulator